MSYAELRAFHVVAAEGSFTRAARLLHVTQPTLSQEVKALEQAYSVRLFERSGRGIQLTAFGRQLFEITRRLFAAEQEATEMLAGAGQVEKGRLTVGADAPFHVIPLIKRFSDRHPGPEVKLELGNSAQVLAGLLDTRIDVGVLAQVPGDARLFVIPFRRDPIRALVPANHVLARRRTLPLSEAAAETLIFRERGSTTRRLVETALAEENLTPARIVEIPSREAVREAVAAGLGLGFVSESESPPDPRVVLKPVTGARMEMDEFVVCLRERRRLAVVRAFLSVASEIAAQAPARPALG